MPAFAPCLPTYGFERVGTLWDLRPREVPNASAIYALVAPFGIVTYDRWGITTVDDEDTYTQQAPAPENQWIEPSEIFYVGSARNVRTRMSHYKSAARFGTVCMSEKSFNRARAHYCTFLLRMARGQEQGVDVYVRQVPQELSYIEGLPIDLRRGWEIGLIRLLQPRGNRGW